MASNWVNDEIDLAWQQKNTPEGKRIIPLLLQPCAVRPSLRLLHMVSFQAPRPYEEALAELLATLHVPSGTDSRQGPLSSGALPPVVPQEDRAASLVQQMRAQIDEAARAGDWHARPALLWLRALRG